MRKINNIVFDIGSVIINDHEEDALSNASFSYDEINILKREIYDREDITSLDYGYEKLPEYFDRVTQNISADLKAKARVFFLNSCKWRITNNNIINLIKYLKDNGYNVYILSDNNEKTYTYLKNNILDKYINKWIVSFMFHCTKSDEKLFEVFFEECNLSPDTCYFIDDKKINIINAKKRGMDGFCFEKSDNVFTKLINDMNAKNIITNEDVTKLLLEGF